MRLRVPIRLRQAVLACLAASFAAPAWAADKEGPDPSRRLIVGKGDTISLDGGLTLLSIKNEGEVTVAGSVSATGDLTNEGGFFFIAGDLDAADLLANIDGQLSIGGKATVGGDLSNYGALEVAGGLDVASELYSEGKLVVAGDLTVKGSFDLADASSSVVSGTLTTPSITFQTSNVDLCGGTLGGGATDIVIDAAALQSFGLPDGASVSLAAFDKVTAALTLNQGQTDTVAGYVYSVGVNEDGGLSLTAKRAAGSTWTGASDAWNDAANWSAKAAPGAESVLHFAGAGATAVQLPEGAKAAAVNIDTSADEQAAELEYSFVGGDLTTAALAVKAGKLLLASSVTVSGEPGVTVVGERSQLTVAEKSDLETDTLTVRGALVNEGDVIVHASLKAADGSVVNNGTLTLGLCTGSDAPSDEPEEGASDPPEEADVAGLAEEDDVDTVEDGEAGAIAEEDAEPGPASATPAESGERSDARDVTGTGIFMVNNSPVHVRGDVRQRVLSVLEGGGLTVGGDIATTEQLVVSGGKLEAAKDVHSADFHVEGDSVVAVLGDVTATGSVWIAGSRATVDGDVKASGCVYNSKSVFDVNYNVLVTLNAQEPDMPNNGCIVNEDTMNVRGGIVAPAVSNSGNLCVGDDIETESLVNKGQIVADGITTTSLDNTALLDAADMTLKRPVKVDGRITISGELKLAAGDNSFERLFVGVLNHEGSLTVADTLTVLKEARLGDLKTGMLGVEPGASVTVSGTLTVNDITLDGADSTLSGGTLATAGKDVNFIVPVSALQAMGLSEGSSKLLASFKAVKSGALTLNGKRSVEIGGYSYALGADERGVVLKASLDGAKAWTGSTGAWAEGSNWSAGSAPDEKTVANFMGKGVEEIQLPEDAKALAVNLDASKSPDGDRNLYAFSGGSLTTGSLTVNGGALRFATSAVVTDAVSGGSGAVVVGEGCSIALEDGSELVADSLTVKGGMENSGKIDVLGPVVSVGTEIFNAGPLHMGDESRLGDIKGADGGCLFMAGGSATIEGDVEQEGVLLYEMSLLSVVGQVTLTTQLSISGGSLLQITEDLVVPEAEVADSKLRSSAGVKVGGTLSVSQSEVETLENLEAGKLVLETSKLSLERGAVKAGELDVHPGATAVEGDVVVSGRLALAKAAELSVSGALTASDIALASLSPDSLRGGKLVAAEGKLNVTIDPLLLQSVNLVAGASAPIAGFASVAADTVTLNGQPSVTCGDRSYALGVEDGKLVLKVLKTAN